MKNLLNITLGLALAFGLTTFAPTSFAGSDDKKHDKKHDTKDHKNDHKDDHKNDKKKKH
ncbi:MAG: hypothetical protein NW208_16065 [Bryobacter sp.]|nr:hypothetical protein [Bryobacter sp.]